jgi:hypothetical protein
MNANKKFNVGNIIIYTNKNMTKEQEEWLSINVKLNNEMYRPQIVISNSERFYTRFMDNGVLNDFAFGSSYTRNCILIDEWDMCVVYSNGVPVIWGDNI